MARAHPSAACQVHSRRTESWQVLGVVYRLAIGIGNRSVTCLAFLGALKRLA